MAGGNTRQGRFGTDDGGSSGQEEAGNVARTSGVGWERTPLGKVVGGTRTPQEMQCCSPQYRWDHKLQRPEGRSHQHKAPHGNQIWPEIFLNCNTDGKGLNDEGRHKTTNKGEPELRPGLYGIGDDRERGKRPRIGISYVRTVSDQHEKELERGWTAVRTADADTKQDGQKTAN